MRRAAPSCASRAKAFRFSWPTRLQTDGTPTKVSTMVEAERWIANSVRTSVRAALMRVCGSSTQNRASLTGCLNKAEAAKSGGTTERVGRVARRTRFHSLGPKKSPWPLSWREVEEWLQEREHEPQGHAARCLV